MLRQLSKYGGGARGVVTLVTSVLPLVIIGGLLYAGLFVKAEAVVRQVDPPTIERRDRFYGVSVIDGRLVWAVGSAGKIVKSRDGGASWTRQTSPVDANLQGIAAWDGEHAVAAGNDGVIVYTADGGETWGQAQVPAADHPNKLFRVRIFGDVAWAVGEFNTLLRSDDRGASWRRVLPVKDRAWNDVTFVGERGWLVGEFGAVMRSDDGGATWTAVDGAGEEGQPSLMSVAFRDAEHGVAVGLSGTVLTTSDGGLTWNRHPALTREHLLSVIWDDSGDAKAWVAVGDKGVMARAGADGLDWKMGRVAAGDVSWRTQIASSGGRYFLAGANLAILHDGKLTVAGGRAL